MRQRSGGKEWDRGNVPGSKWDGSIPQRVPRLPIICSKTQYIEM